MKRHVFTIITLIFVILSFILIPSCTKAGNDVGNTEGSEAEGIFPYTFTDSSGKSITLSKKPEKVAVLFSSFAEIWALSGGDIDITVGDSIERGFAEDGVILVDSGAGHTSINTEMLIESMPDLVICTSDYAVQADCAAQLNLMGIPSAVFRVESVEDYLGVLKIFTDINGSPDVYEEHGVRLSEDISSLLSRVAEHTEGKEKKEILFIRAGSSARSTKAKSSADNFACRMLEELNTYNIADSAPILLDGLSLEEIILRDPEFIFITSMGSEEASRAYINDLFSRDGWSSLSAVKDGKVIFLDKETFHYKPNSRWHKAYSFLCDILYPELNIE